MRTFTVLTKGLFVFNHRYALFFFQLTFLLVVQTVKSSGFKGSRKLEEVFGSSLEMKTLTNYFLNFLSRFFLGGFSFLLP